MNWLESALTPTRHYTWAKKVDIAMAMRLQLATPEEIAKAQGLPLAEVLLIRDTDRRYCLEHLRPLLIGAGKLPVSELIEWMKTQPGYWDALVDEVELVARMMIGSWPEHLRWPVDRRQVLAA